jgi:hypothetical protein
MLHVRFAKKGVIKAFYSPVQKNLFWRRAVRVFLLPDITCPTKPSPCSALFPDVFTPNKI